METLSSVAASPQLSAKGHNGARPSRDGVFGNRDKSGHNYADH